ncbi:MAG: penicillin-binding protein 1C [Deltaproteobacteria bacterium]|nr:penicillin-binding protein 1C [Deltaproteobacteria bacterium]
MSRKRALRALLALVCLPVAACCLWFAFCPKPPLLEGVAFSRVILDRNGQLLRLSLAADEKYRERAALRDFPPALIQATLLYEDRYFSLHPGFNPFSLLRAAAHTYLGGGRRMGASTITMQLVRLRCGINTGKISGKIEQILRAVQFERHYDKDELLEAYLNLAPYGGNVEGAAAAARVYFGKNAARLTTGEALALAIVPQNPTRRTPLKAGQGGDFDRARQRLLELHQAEYANHAAQAALPLHILGPDKLPFAAPHVCAELAADKNTDAGPVRTTLDLEVQRRLEGMISRFAARNRAWGIANAAALLIHCPSMEIRALVGSADFHSAGLQGQVDGTRARRSPGSTLKPFIYALALDQGLIHPMTMLMDSPRSYGGYDPENFDKSFRGPLAARDALAASRNLPALGLAARLANPDLYAFLRRAGTEFPHDAEHYGLSLVLGGAELTMRELGALYAMLANKGLWRPARLRADDPPQPTPLLSPEAAFITRDMLRDPAHAVRARTGHLPLHLKTGTSNGFRDAWTAGLFGPYALVVWVGNFDNSANPLLVGADTALPLFVDIAQNIAEYERLEDMTRELRRDLNVSRILACTVSGDIDVSLCPQTTETWFIPGVSPIAPSGVFRKILVDVKTGLRACVPEEGRTAEKVWEFWPSDMLRIFRRAGIHKPPPPAWAPDCANDQAASKGPRIITPKDHVIYRVRLSTPERNTLALTAGADAESGALFWFADKEFLGRCAPEEPLLWQARAGLHRLRVVDDKGRSHSRTVLIEAVP